MEAKGHSQVHLNIVERLSFSVDVWKYTEMVKLSVAIKDIQYSPSNKDTLFAK